MKRVINGCSVSPMGYGAMSFSNFYGDVTDKEIRAILDNLLDLGVTHIDTANIYGRGRSETQIGAFFSQSSGVREKFFLATKGGIVMENNSEKKFDNDPDFLREALEGSLARLGVDCVDLYYVHRRDQSIPIEDVAGTLARFVDEGKTKAIGFSEISPASLRRAQAVTQVHAVQSEYSLQTRQPELGVSQICAKTGTAFVAFSPVGRSLLTDNPHDRTKAETMPFLKNNPRFMEPNISENIAAAEDFRKLASDFGLTAAGLAVAWVLSKGDHITPIPGTRSVDRLKELVSGANRRLSSEDVKAVENVLPMGWVSGDRYSEQQWIGPERYA